MFDVIIMEAKEKILKDQSKNIYVLVNYNPTKIGNFQQIRSLLGRVYSASRPIRLYVNNEHELTASYLIKRILLSISEKI